MTFLDHVFLLGFCICSIEILSVLNVKECLVIISKKGLASIRVILSNKISDHWKETATQMYAAVIIVNVLKVGFSISLISLGLLCIDHFYFNFVSALLSIEGIFKSVVVSVIYIAMKKYTYE